MRARGAKVTDIAVLVVAADDGVMPQTKESISHARAAEVPIVVAVNKIDAPGRRPEPGPHRARRRRAAAGGVGRDDAVLRCLRQAVDQDLDDLLEKVLLVADAELELKANPNAEASGPIIESRLDVGRGPVATMLVHRGTLRVGRRDRRRRRLGQGPRAPQLPRREGEGGAGPGDPVEILGFDNPPPAGELARVVENERQARHLAQLRGQRLRTEQLAQTSPSRRLARGHVRPSGGAVQDLNLVVKGDVVGSVEAALSELQKIQHPEVRVNVIHQGVGGITENDVMLASASQAPRRRLQRPAERRGARARRARGRRDPHLPRHLPADRGHRAGARRHAQAGRDARTRSVRPRCAQLFRVSRLGTIAGC